MVSRSIDPGRLSAVHKALAQLDIAQGEAALQKEAAKLADGFSILRTAGPLLETMRPSYIWHPSGNPHQDMKIISYDTEEGRARLKNADGDKAFTMYRLIDAFSAFKYFPAYVPIRDQTGTVVLTGELFLPVTRENISLFRNTQIAELIQEAFCYQYSAFPNAEPVFAYSRLPFGMAAKDFPTVTEVRTGMDEGTIVSVPGQVKLVLTPEQDALFAKVAANFIRPYSLQVKASPGSNLYRYIRDVIPHRPLKEVTHECLEKLQAGTHIDKGGNVKLLSDLHPKGKYNHPRPLKQLRSFTICERPPLDYGLRRG